MKLYFRGDLSAAESGFMLHAKYRASFWPEMPFGVT
jgi:hypothetical protein